MCKAIIGHCQCLRCMELPKPGMLRRLDYCDTRQLEMAGIWNLSTPENARVHMFPCENMSFVREGDPDSCHFKVTTNEDAEGAIAQKQDKPDTESTTDRAQEKPIEPTEHRGIQFTPINAAAIARAALSTLAKTKSSKAPTNADNDDGQMDVDTTPGSSHNNKDETGRVDTVGTTISNPTTSNSSSNNNNNNPLPLLPPATPTKGKGKQPATSSGGGARTPLPTSRPSTPRVRRAEAAAAAAELEARARGGAWTHEETVRLLLLRCREVEYEDMGEYLPGRDAASCVDRLAGLAVKHGYEDYI
ncbi:hypothetical protein B0I37DRAFT_447964 [Chaetomium sp. MPI-CAGE-AT-0009]|nr:hypothetical protein B0I37DRAFT_447964 [Chaetomium sp. MPI-CAGE-AT-0009]